VRVERVKDITELDARSEGVQLNSLKSMWCGSAHKTLGTPKQFSCAIHAFKDLWNSINGTRVYGWDVNPWVWVVEFKRVED